MNSEGCHAYPLLKEGSLSPLRKMQRYLSQGEAGEVKHEPPLFSWKPLSDLPTPLLKEGIFAASRERTNF
jgi:hypothetical protein